MEEWSLGYLWRWTFLMERLALLGLALMLGYVVLAFAVVSSQLRSARHTGAVDFSSRRFQRKRKAWLAHLNVWIAPVKGIALSAAYLGVAGTFLGLLDTYSTGFSGSRASALHWIAFGSAITLILTAAGCIVSIAATGSYNYLRSRLETLRKEIPQDTFHRSSHFHAAQKLSLSPRFSTIAIAPAFAIFVVGFDLTLPVQPRLGLAVGIAPARCELEGDRQIVLRITADSVQMPKPFLNSEETDWNALESRLSMIYRTRAERVLYVLADAAVPYQYVADAIDIANNTHADPGLKSSDNLNIRVKLITPQTMAARCPLPVLIRSSPRLAK